MRGSKACRIVDVDIAIEQELRLTNIDGNGKSRSMRSKPCDINGPNLWLVVCPA